MPKQTVVGCVCVIREIGRFLMTYLSSASITDDADQITYTVHIRPLSLIHYIQYIMHAFETQNKKKGIVYFHTKKCNLPLLRADSHTILANYKRIKHIVQY